MNPNKYIMRRMPPAYNSGPSPAWRHQRPVGLTWSFVEAWETKRGFFQGTMEKP